MISEVGEVGGLGGLPFRRSEAEGVVHDVVFQIREELGRLDLLLQCVVVAASAEVPDAFPEGVGLLDPWVDREVVRGVWQGRRRSRVAR